MADKKISAAVIKRLPRYYRYLSELLDNGIERISSGELSKQMKVTASQIRQDFNNFGGFGQQGYGYNVPYLKNEIGKILGLDRDYHVIILGAGNLGHALANYAGFEKRGFVVSAVFDVSPDKIGKKIGHTMVYERLRRICKRTYGRYCSTYAAEINCTGSGETACTVWC